MESNVSPENAAELKVPNPPPSNQVVGININRFVGNPLSSPVRITQDVIFTRSILSRGDPYHPGDAGAVLEYHDDLSLGTIIGYRRTPLVQLSEGQFWYVESGRGRLENSEFYWDLHEGVSVLIAPNARYRIINTADDPIQMLMLTWTPEGVTARADILVRDVNALPLSEGEHWNYFGVSLFGPEDGLHPNEQFAVVYMPPMTIAEPHAHTPHFAEVWVKLPPHDSYLMLGSEVREMPPNTAFLAPPNSQTVHSVINLMKHATQAWLYIGHSVSRQAPHAERLSVDPKPLKYLTTVKLER